ncbi:unnamed protein product (mitochondrion) [Plasmodiophora brassicae]|uniref:G-protein coupled receptors family 3 profile domain-containing protein n=1 Tax=Plasmodiophora brassicae TaxID=37360 RepID=A0A0G4IT00_PLABS|nr:hypothetical protein PBRA_006509 [Plasmodiophora brassicae]SPQ94480.1 unnamed protein product [Plasmodiophora brassicae]
MLVLVVVVAVAAAPASGAAPVSACFVSHQNVIMDGGFMEGVLDGMARVAAEVNDASRFKHRVIILDTGEQTRVGNGEVFVPWEVQPGVTDCNFFIFASFIAEPLIQALSAAYANTPGVALVIVDDVPPGTAIPRNAQGLLFRQEQAGYLAGLLAGLVTQTKVVASAGGIPVPPVRGYCNGFKLGVRQTCPSCIILEQYMFDFSGGPYLEPLGRMFANDNADIIYGVGGEAGALVDQYTAIANPNALVVGVDADYYISTFANSTLKSRVLGTALKKVDVSIYVTLKSVLAGTFQGGTNAFFDASNGGVGLSPCHDACSHVPASFATIQSKAISDLATGALTLPLDGNYWLARDLTHVNAMMPVTLYGRAPDPASTCAAVNVSNAWGSYIYQFGDAHRIWSFDVLGDNWSPESSSTLMNVTGMGPAALAESCVASIRSADGSATLAVQYGGNDPTTMTVSGQVNLLLNGRGFADLYLHWQSLNVPPDAAGPGQRWGSACAVTNNVGSPVFYTMGGRGLYQFFGDVWYLNLSGAWTPNKVPPSAAWQQLQTLPDPVKGSPPVRNRHRSVLVGDRSWYVLGGEWNGNALRDAWVLDLNSGQWTALPPMPIALTQFTVVVVTISGRNVLVVQGGRTTDASIPMSTYVYLIISREWVAVPMTYGAGCGPRAGHSAVSEIRPGDQWWITHVGGVQYDPETKQIGSATAPCRVQFDGQALLDKVVTYRYVTVTSPANATIVAIAWAVALLGAVGALMLLGMVYRHRDDAIIKASSYAFNLYTLVSLCACFLSCIPYLVPASTTVCALRWWLPTLSIVALLSVIAAKAYRIWKVFCTDSMKVVRLPNRKLLLPVTIDLILATLMLTVVTVADPPVPYLEVTVTGSLVTQTVACPIHAATAVPVAVAIFLPLFVCAFVAFQTRHAPSTFNESTHMTLGLYGAIFSFVVFPLISMLVPAQPQIYTTLFILGILWCSISFTTAIYFPKATLIWQGKGNLKLHTKSDLKHTPGILIAVRESSNEITGGGKMATSLYDNLVVYVAFLEKRLAENNIDVSDGAHLARSAGLQRA